MKELDERDEEALMLLAREEDNYNSKLDGSMTMVLGRR